MKSTVFHSAQQGFDYFLQTYGTKTEKFAPEYTRTYSFGFNGMEKTNEVYGNGNEYTTEFRQYDPRLGRWFTTDPVIQPWQSPYSAFNDAPTIYTDPFGLYATKKEARRERRAAKKVGLDPGKIYKSGKDYGFNTVEDGAIVGNFRATSFGSKNTEESKGTGDNPILNFNFSFNTHPKPTSIFEKTQNAIGTISTLAGTLDKDFVGNMTLGISHSNVMDLRIYEGWGGNQYFSTIKVARAGRIIGNVTFVASEALDLYGLYNYYHNPNAEFVVSPLHAGTNLGVGVYGIFGGPPAWIMSSAYFIFMALPPDEQKAVIQGYIEIERSKIDLWRKGITQPTDYMY